MADEVTMVDVPVPNGDAGPVDVETEIRPTDAPWGFKADGSPYKRDPAIYERRASGSKRRKPGAPRAKASKPAKRSPHREAVLGAVQIVGLPLAALGTRDPRFMADLIALNTCAEPIADAMESLAEQNEGVAKALDKLGEVGPYGLLIGAVAPLVLQIAANHGVVPAGVAGTVAPEDLLEAAGITPEPGPEPEGMAA